MTTPRIEEEYLGSAHEAGWYEPNELVISWELFKQALTEAYQAGIKRAERSKYVQNKMKEAHQAGIDEAVEHFVEPVARAIYNQMSYTEQGVKPEWVQGGNSLKQDEARRLAIKALQDKE